MDAIRNYFELKLKHCFDNHYLILIIDRHTFYVYNKFVKFMHKYKIVY